MPELGEGIETATIALWHFQAGERINKGDDIVEVVTDKASFNIPAPASGILKDILVQPGQDVPIGKSLATIE